jgi:putative phosphoesterase
MDHIIHAGDVGDWDIITSLQTLAPVTAVYGNCDSFGMRRRLKNRESLHLEGFSLEITHIPSQDDYQFVHGTEQDIKIFGHTHDSVICHIGPVLVINPGSATRPRGQDHPTVVILELVAGEMPTAEIKFLR